MWWGMFLSHGWFDADQKSDVDAHFSDFNSGAVSESRPPQSVIVDLIHHQKQFQTCLCFELPDHRRICHQQRGANFAFIHGVHLFINWMQLVDGSAAVGVIDFSIPAMPLRRPFLGFACWQFSSQETADSGAEETAIHGVRINFWMG